MEDGPVSAWFLEIAQLFPFPCWKRSKPVSVCWFVEMLLVGFLDELLSEMLLLGLMLWWVDL